MSGEHPDVFRGDWLQRWDPGSKKYYYSNKKTRETRWTPPTNWDAIAVPAPVKSGPPPVNGGPPPVNSGPPPVKSGPPPVKSGPPPVQSGPPPAKTGPSPVKSNSVPVQSNSADGVLQGDWMRRLDPRSQKFYYSNAKTRQTRWTPPPIWDEASVPVESNAGGLTAQIKANRWKAAQIKKKQEQKEREAEATRQRKTNEEKDDRMEQKYMKYSVAPGKKGVVRVQELAFLRWVNFNVTKRGINIQELFNDLVDGVALINLLEVIAETKLPRHFKHPKGNFQRLQNLRVLCDWLWKTWRISLTGQDLADRNPEKVLDFVWMVILGLQIYPGGHEDPNTEQREVEARSLQEDRAMKELIDWVNVRLKGVVEERTAAEEAVPQQGGSVTNSMFLKKITLKDVKPIENFTTDIANGHVLCALVESISRQQVKVVNDPLKDVATALEKAQELFNIPALHEVKDVVEHPDTRAMMTYMSLLREHARGWGANADPASCSATGVGVKQSVEGDLAMLLVHVNDSDEHRVAIPEDRLTVEVYDSDGSPLEEAVIIDNKNGTLSASYMSKRAGMHQIKICVDGEEIKDSPYTCDVRAKERPEVDPGDDCLLSILDCHNDYHGWIDEEGTCYDKYGEISGYIWGDACGGGESEQWGYIEHDIVYNMIETQIGCVQLDRGWVRDGDNRTIAEFDRDGSFRGNTGIFGGKFEGGFSYHNMNTVALYLLLVDSSMLNDDI